MEIVNDIVGVIVKMEPWEARNLGYQIAEALMCATGHGLSIEADEGLTKLAAQLTSIVSAVELFLQLL